MVVLLSLTWLLLEMLLSDWLTAVLSRDFTLKDIVQLHLLATPYPGSFKCFICEEADDNYSCNRWAPDTYCPKDTRFCYTHHRISSVGGSVAVTKRCVAQEACVSTGCVTHHGHMVCTSCCEGNMCNLPVPWNETTAIFSTKYPLNRESRICPSSATTITIIILTLGFS
ncbi:ly6/PLAUR domain-containing protein 6-like [Electrophorus electricus]|uniref:LY6/PLAUR domain containing 6 n=1 Tax=Electrophorus electricus TaxID=8005 RepID=A0A4W4F8X7_ELEEL|nr:ly6/PLAUR domain-containing protein 6-like [Electrophorus electricus]XP_035380831.1 ly6/PLAUR domain-containing protein 6-like [Electrophorus electricus]